MQKLEAIQVIAREAVCASEEDALRHIQMILDGDDVVGCLESFRRMEALAADEYDTAVEEAQADRDLALQDLSINWAQLRGNADGVAGDVAKLRGEAINFSDSRLFND